LEKVRVITILTDIPEQVYSREVPRVLHVLGIGLVNDQQDLPGIQLMPG
jgi:hypothetical protein